MIHMNLFLYMNDQSDICIEQIKYNSQCLTDENKKLKL